MPEHIPHTDGEILNDEIVIIHPSGLVGEPEIFKPNTEVCLHGIIGDVGGWSEALWERRSLDTLVKGPWSRTLRAGTLVVQPATVPRMCFIAPLDGSARIHVACSHHCSVDVIIMPGPMPVTDNAMSVFVWPEPLVHRRPVWSGR